MFFILCIVLLIALYPLLGSNTITGGSQTFNLCDMDIQGRIPLLPADHTVDKYLGRAAQDVNNEIKHTILDNPDEYWAPREFVLNNRQRERLISVLEPYLVVTGHEDPPIIDANAGDCYDAVYFALRGYRVHALTRSPAANRVIDLYGVSITTSGGGLKSWLRLNRGAVAIHRGPPSDISAILAAGALFVVLILPSATDVRNIFTDDVMYRAIQDKDIQFVICSRNIPTVV